MTGLVDVIGYGSLLSRDSAVRTAPSVSRFRLVTVHGYRRVFGKVSPRWYRAPDRPRGDRIASCAARPAPGVSLVCSAFSVTETDFLRLFEREHAYRWASVPCVEADSSLTAGRMCLEWTDADYRLNRCITDTEYHRRVGRFYDGPLWRDDILPFPPYLDECLRAARAHGPEVYENFCRTSFLADGTTTISEYLRRVDPSGGPG